MFLRLKEEQERGEICQPMCFSFSNVFKCFCAFVFALVCAFYFYLCSFMRDLCNLATNVSEVDMDRSSFVLLVIHGCLCGVFMCAHVCC